MLTPYCRSIQTTQRMRHRQHRRHFVRISRWDTEPVAGALRNHADPRSGRHLTRPRHAVSQLLQHRTLTFVKTIQHSTRFRKPSGSWRTVRLLDLMVSHRSYTCTLRNPWIGHATSCFTMKPYVGHFTSCSIRCKQPAESPSGKMVSLCRCTRERVR